MLALFAVLMNNFFVFHVMYSIWVGLISSIHYFLSLKNYGYSPGTILPHGSYLLNCGAPNEDVLRKSQNTLTDELQRCEMLGLSLYNFHPGIKFLHTNNVQIMFHPLILIFYARVTLNTICNKIIMSVRTTPSHH